MESITAYATSVVTKPFFRSQADTFLDRLPADKFIINQRHKTITKSISGVLVGHVVEMFYNIRFGEPYVLDQIDSAIKKHKDLYEKVCQIGFQKFDDSWIVYDERKYEIVLEQLEADPWVDLRLALHQSLGEQYQIGLSITRKEYMIHEMQVHEEKAYKWIRNEDYYGRIIARLENLKTNCEKFMEDNDVTHFLEHSCVSGLVLFTNVSNQWYHRGNDSNKFETHFHEKDDIIYIQELLKNAPIIDPKKSYVSRPSLRFDIQRRISRKKYELYFHGTPDFIIDNYIVDIKTINSVSRKDYRQVLFYYILAKYGCCEHYPKIKGCKLVYVKQNKIITLDFSKIITANEGTEFNEYVTKNIFTDYIETEKVKELGRMREALKKEKRKIRKEQLKEIKRNEKLKK